MDYFGNYHIENIYFNHGLITKSRRRGLTRVLRHTFNVAISDGDSPLADDKITRMLDTRVTDVLQMVNKLQYIE